MTHDQIISDIDAGRFSPVYFLEGDESFFIDDILDRLEEKVVSEAEKSFNQSILYGKETQMADILSEAKRFPMMSERVLVLVREAQHLRKSDLELLETYLDGPNPTTVLAFGYKGKKLDGRMKLSKTLKKSAVYFQSKKLYDNQLPAWIGAHAQRNGLRLDPQGIHIIAEYLGSDLGRIYSELEKLKIAAKDGQAIDGQQVAEQIGVHRDFNVFELTKALSRGDQKRVMQIAFYAAANPKELNPIMVVSILFTYFEKIIRLHSVAPEKRNQAASEIGVAPFLLQEYQEAARRFPLKASVAAMKLLLEYDRRLKGVNSGTTSSSEWLKELLLRLIHLQKAT